MKGKSSGGCRREFDFPDIIFQLFFVIAAHRGSGNDKCETENDQQKISRHYGAELLGSVLNNQLLISSDRPGDDARQFDRLDGFCQVGLKPGGERALAILIARVGRQRDGGDGAALPRG